MYCTVGIALKTLFSEERPVSTVSNEAKASSKSECVGSGGDIYRSFDSDTIC